MTTSCFVAFRGDWLAPSLPAEVTNIKGCHIACNLCIFFHIFQIISRLVTIPNTMQMLCELPLYCTVQGARKSVHIQNRHKYCGSDHMVHKQDLKQTCMTVTKALCKHWRLWQRLPTHLLHDTAGPPKYNKLKFCLLEFCGFFFPQPSQFYPRMWMCGYARLNEYHKVTASFLGKIIWMFTVPPS